MTDAGDRPLTFDELRRANVARLPNYKNAQGACTFSDVTHWSPAQWLMALVGEVGETANILKKIERGDYDLGEPGVRANLGKELADVQCYLDLLALRCGIDLGRATVAKFNEVSRRVGSDVLLHGEGEVL